jgi:hypothetical protein
MACDPPDQQVMQECPQYLHVDVKTFMASSLHRITIAELVVCLRDMTQTASLDLCNASPAR